MKKLLIAPLFASTVLAGAAQAEVPAANVLTVKLEAIENNKPIPEKFAFCQPDGNGKIKDGGNLSPAISWSGAPGGTQSYAIIVVDKDVPTSFESANQDGKTIAQDFPRQNFYHWALIDVPASITGLPEGKDSKGVTPGGKLPGKTSYGINGTNDFAMKAKMNKGGGYDGPCPPWNDERLHRYHFQVYALDIPSLKLEGEFDGKKAEDAMAGHILAKGEVVGTFTNNLKITPK